MMDENKQKAVYDEMRHAALYLTSVERLSVEETLTAMLTEIMVRIATSYGVASTVSAVEEVLRQMKEIEVSDQVPVQ